MTNQPTSSAEQRGRTPEEILPQIWVLAEDKLARDPVVLDLRKISGFADYFLILTGNSEPHIKAIVDGIGKGLREWGLHPRSVEGVPASHWTIMDYGDIVIHVFHPETRQHYALEFLWNDADRWTPRGEGAR
ncbi:MAG: ribosome silencing factor [Verrucomicrobiota bacterium]|jgi:ribosome-associated protein|nr:ribosome silencing factor [Verrucomicrobiota bacterium]MDD8047489.1 ribosome silencing factor [Verrucomicrobiota bacterium]MDD8051627.1 ribosome silencing factor [Verrucomicrobiota bacterium]MDI9385828.1 ribosome silencing factor [Verrucomicrobiota bacterium]